VWGLKIFPLPNALPTLRKACSFSERRARSKVEQLDEANQIPMGLGHEEYPPVDALKVTLSRKAPGPAPGRGLTPSAAEGDMSACVDTQCPGVLSPTSLFPTLRNTTRKPMITPMITL
jgi:hypothetical protein